VDTEATSREIVTIRKRLTEIEERMASSDRASIDSPDLLDEEHRLRARLATLQAHFSRDENEIARELHGDPKRPPQQPVV
jgi:hypothetical protein